MRARACVCVCVLCVRVCVCVCVRDTACVRACAFRITPPPSVVSFALALNRAHVLALNTAHVLRLTKADVLALNKAHVLRLTTKICPVFTANTKETTKGGAAEGRPPH